MTLSANALAVARAMPEADLLACVLGTPRRPGLALALGWRGYHTHRSQHSPAGWPDLALVRRGRLILAELKTERGKVTPEQAAWIDDLERVRDDSRADALTARRANDPVLGVYVWRPRDYLDGTIERILRGGDTPTPGLALPPRVR